MRKINYINYLLQGIKLILKIYILSKIFLIEFENILTSKLRIENQQIKKYNNIYVLYFKID